MNVTASPLSSALMVMMSSFPAHLSILFCCFRAGGDDGGGAPRQWEGAVGGGGHGPEGDGPAGLLGDDLHVRAERHLKLGLHSNVLREELR